MAAPFKTGLDYYPRKVKFSDDRRFIGLKMKWGNKAVGLYEQILDAIYSDKGYYISIKDDERDTLIKWLWFTYAQYDGLNADDIEEMIEMMVEEKLFDRNMYDRGILTSVEIQEVYYTATAKRKELYVDEALWMLNIERMEALGKRSPIYKQFFSKINDVNNSQTKQNKTRPNKIKPNETKPLPTGEGEAAEGCGGVGERDNKIRELCKKYFGVFHERDTKKVSGWGSAIDLKVIEDAFKLTAERGKGLYYADAVIQRLISEGTLTWEDYARKELQTAPAKPAKSSAPYTTKFVNYNQPEYTDEEINDAIERKKQRRREQSENAEITLS